MRTKITKVKMPGKTFYDVTIGQDRYGYPIRLGRYERYGEAVNAARQLIQKHELVA